MGGRSRQARNVAVLALCHATTFSGAARTWWGCQTCALGSLVESGALLSVDFHTRVVRRVKASLRSSVLSLFKRVTVFPHRQRASVPNGCPGGRRNAVHFRKSIFTTGLSLTVTDNGKLFFAGPSSRI